MSKEYGDLSLRSKIELSESEQLFIIDQLKSQINLNKILELGTFRGGVTNLIHQTLPEAQIFSIDLSSDPEVGSLFEGDSSKVKFFKGKYAFEVMEEIGGDIDLVFIDTDHVLPGELLDFLMVKPFLHKHAEVIIHDIDLYRINPEDEEFSFAPRMLFNTLYGLKVSQWNIGRVSLLKPDMDETILSCLTFPWNNLDIIEKKNELISFLEKHYSVYFVDEFNKICYEQLARKIKNFSS